MLLIRSSSPQLQPIMGWREGEARHQGICLIARQTTTIPTFTGIHIFTSLPASPAPSFWHALSSGVPLQSLINVSVGCWLVQLCLSFEIFAVLCTEHNGHSSPLFATPLSELLCKITKLLLGNIWSWEGSFCCLIFWSGFPGRSKPVSVSAGEWHLARVYSPTLYISMNLCSSEGWWSYRWFTLHFLHSTIKSSMIMMFTSIGNQSNHFPFREVSSSLSSYIIYTILHITIIIHSWFYPVFWLLWLVHQ